GERVVARARGGEQVRRRDADLPGQSAAGATGAIDRRRDARELDEQDRRRQGGAVDRADARGVARSAPGADGRDAAAGSKEREVAECRSVHDRADRRAARPPAGAVQLRTRSITTNLALEAEYRYELQRP